MHDDQTIRLIAFWGICTWLTDSVEVRVALVTVFIPCCFVLTGLSGHYIVYIIHIIYVAGLVHELNYRAPGGFSGTRKTTPVLSALVTFIEKKKKKWWGGGGGGEERHIRTTCQPTLY